ncbi:MAG: tRNA pseudouridine(55) synthase TruB [Acidobacteriaceae bacterium]
MVNGAIVVDKPSGMTSHDVVARLRRIYGERSVGHLGTLDPMATGVLPLVMGRYTRLAQFYGESVKGYEGEIRFGFATDTYDADGTATTAEASTASLTLKAIIEVLKKFVGRIEQTPPPYSAKKVKGVPAYKHARKNQVVELAPVPVEVFEFEICDYAEGRARFRALVSSGTYIRSLAHDLGRELGLGAHLTVLRRTRAGEFSIDDSHTLEELEAMGESRMEALIHPRRLIPEMPSVTVTDEIAGYIRNGRAVNLSDLSNARMVKVFQGQTELIAIASRVAGTLFHAKVVLFGNNEK